jgi:leucyl aminopeptidase
MSLFSLVAQPKCDIVFIPLRQISATAPLSTAVTDLTGISEQVLQSVFKGNVKEVFQTVVAPQRRFFLMGCGEKLSLDQLTEQFRLLFFQNQTSFEGKVSIDLRHLGLGQDVLACVSAVVEGVVMGLHQPVKLLKPAEKPSVKVKGVEVCVEGKFAEGAIKKAIQRGETLAEIRSTIIDLVNTPSNFKTPRMLADFVSAQGKKYGFKVEVYREKELKAKGFHALLAIGQGSVEESAFIMMKYQGTKKKTTDVGLVGKGITFDTGGISIKPSDNMHFMKSDMGGAAMMLGATMAAAAFQLPINLATVIAAAENMPSGNAIKPSDVFSSYSGKTIEMIDTDAEGRVVLADALAWMVKNEKPDVMLDAATLTGSIVRTLGSKAAGVFTKNEYLQARLLASADASGERIWPMPLWDDYNDEIASDVADVRNFSGVPTAGSISAAKFLEAFTDNHPAWAHFDIAGMAFNANPYTKMRSATGYGIKLILDFLKKSSAK